MRLDGYVRVSTVKGRAGDTFISPAVQTDRIRAYCALHGHDLVVVHEELDESGGREDRPKLLEALRRVETGRVDGIIVAKVDRFSRSVAGALQAIKRIEAVGGELVSIDEQFDTSTAVGRAMLKIVLVFAELTRERIAEDWLVAKRRAVSRGVHVAPRVPLGYRRLPDGRLEADPVTGPLVTRLFRLRAGGASSGELARILNKAQVRTAHGSPLWRSSSVTKMLDNRVYLGEARAARDIVCPDAHQPLVTPDVFAAAGRTKPRAYPRGSHGDLLLGLIRCAGCRYVMSARPQTNARGRVYGCKIQHSLGTCPQPAVVSARLVEAYVVDSLFTELRETTAEVGDLVADIQPGRDLEPLLAELADTDAELAAWRDATSIRALGEDIYVAGLQTRISRREAAHAAVLEAQQATGGHSRIPLDREAFENRSRDQQRRYVAGAIDVVFLRGGRMPIHERTLILWRGQGPDDLPGRGRRSDFRSFPFPADTNNSGREELLDDLTVRRHQRVPSSRR